MMTFEHNETVIHYNSDLSGSVLINGEAVEGEALDEFLAVICQERLTTAIENAPNDTVVAAYAALMLGLRITKK